MIKRRGYKILIVDDEIEYQKVMSLILEDLGYSIDTCSNGIEALEYIEKNSVQLILTDLKMPKMDGVELIKKVKEKYEDMNIIVMTAFGSIESAVDSIKYGATDYFPKSGDMKELILKIDRLAKIYRLERKSSFLLENQNTQEFFMESKNPEYLKLLEMCERVADTDINILILGESGVGKEVIANYIHRLSKRDQEPFVPVNCQVFPEGVIESELFGHEKGSFTGAKESRVGKFEQANLGTLFLDEIGDLPIPTQSKLLRAIESKKIQRLGSNKSIDLDVRFLSATNKDLSKLIEEAEFREDLLYRINALTIVIPPLRERKEDLPDLINFFIRKIKMDQKKKDIKIDKEVIKFLLNYDYPGNIRELKNTIERMIALSRNNKVTVDDLLMPRSECENMNIINENKSLKEARSEFETKYISNALVNNDGNVSKTSEDLDISSRHLWNKINEYKINVDKIREN